MATSKVAKQDKVLATKKKQQKAKANLFAKSKEKAGQPSSKTANDVVEVKAALGKKIAQWKKLGEQLAQLAAQEGALKGQIKEEARPLFVEKYKQQKERVTSIKLQHAEASCRFIVQARSPKLSAEYAEELEEKYGKGFVEEETQYKLNAKLVDKYSDELSEAIMASSNIPEEDKAALIEASVSYKISKEVFEDFEQWGDVAEVMKDVSPIEQLKDSK